MPEINKQFLRYIVNADLTAIKVVLEERPDLANQKDRLELVEGFFLKKEYYLIQAIKLINLSLHLEGNYPPNQNKLFREVCANEFNQQCKDTLSLLNRDVYKIKSTKEYEEVIKLLIEKGADVNCLDSSGESALQMAAHLCSPEIVKLMLTKNPDMRGAKNPMASALLANNEENIRLLIQAGADMVDRATGRPFLFMAVVHTSLRIVELLIQAKAPIDVPDVHGLTPCMFAVHRETGNLDIFKALLPANPDLSLRDVEGKTAFDYINERADAQEFLAAIKEFGDINEKTPEFKYDLPFF